MRYVTQDGLDERPAVDGRVLDSLARTMLHVGDCTPVSDSSCRLHPQRARAVAGARPVAQERLDAQAEWPCNHLAANS